MGGPEPVVFFVEYPPQQLIQFVVRLLTYNMSDQQTDEIPVMQRLYNKVWLLALAGILFFFITYLGWGLIDILSVPAR